MLIMDTTVSGCLLYADDIVLLAHSLNAIRQMVEKYVMNLQLN